MRKSIGWSLVLVLPLAVVAILLRPTRPSIPIATTPSQPLSTPPAGIATSSTSPSTAQPEPAAPVQATRPASDEVSRPLFVEGLEATLRADDEGKLVLDSEARQALEMLIGMSARERSLRQQRLVQQLPAVAAAQALELLQRLGDYRTAAVQTFPRESPPKNIEEVRSMLASLHQLRVDYLGEATARAFFEQDERAARGFVEAISRNASPNGGEDPRSAMVADTVFSLFILPRKPPRAIGQQDP